MEIKAKNKSITIAGSTIMPGRNTVLELEIARLPSGTVINMQVHIFRSKKPGPVVLLSGGLHGDEINGIEIVRRLVTDGDLDEMSAGTVIAIPIINVYGFIQFSREVPDGKDINRSFPGNPEGSLAGLVAHNITKHILPVIDFGIDFHTGGASRTNYPQIRFEPNNIQARKWAEVFAPPLYFESPIIDGSLRATASSLKKTILVYEGGESLRFSEKAIRMGIEGTKRVLHHAAMIEEQKVKDIDYKPTELTNSQWIRADISGLFKCDKKYGEAVEANEIIGSISSPYGDYREPVRAPFSGILISHNNMPLVHRGDALFHLGFVKQ